MNNILKLAAIVVCTITASQAQAIELVKANTVTPTALTEIAKVNIASAIKLNPITLEATQETARNQATVNLSKLTKTSKSNVKTVTLAE